MRKCVAHFVVSLSENEGVLTLRLVLLITDPMRILLILSILMFLHLNADALTMLDSVSNPVHLGRARNVDIQHVKLELSVDWKSQQLVGRATISARMLESVEAISLDAAMLEIQSIKDERAASLSFQYDGSDQDNALKISLSKRASIGEVITLVIDYRTRWVNKIDPNFLSGSTGKGPRFSAPTKNDPLKPKEVWTMSEPQSNRYWFPSYDSPGDLRTTEMVITVEKGLVALSNGELKETKENGDGSRTFHWVMDTPYANHLTSLVIGPYVDAAQSWAGVTLHSYGYPHEVEATQASVVRLPDMIRFFSEKTGVRYPFSQYSQVFVQDLPWGYGSATLAMQSENMVDDAGTHDDFLYLWDGLEAESLARQWFAVHVPIRDWKDIWLEKAFAHYFDGLYSEYKNGVEEFQMWHRLGGDLSTYLWEWNSNVRHPLVTRDFASVYEFVTYDNQPSGKGAMVLHMLRRHLGDERWWSAIRLYLKRQAGTLTTTEDFRHAIEDATGEPMDWFFDQWVYGMGHPVFEIEKNFDAKTSQLALTVRQVQKRDSLAKHPQVEFFRGFVDVEIDNDIRRVWIAPTSVNKFTFAVQANPKVVNFDHDGTWIKEYTFKKSTREWMDQLAFSRDIASKRTAMTELANVAKEPSTSKEVRADIEAALRNVAVSRAYWRVRTQALGQLQGILVGSNSSPIKLDDPTRKMLLSLIQNEKSWLKASAIGFLGATRDPKYAPIYIEALRDVSDRVVNQATVALGKSKSPKAFAALQGLPARPSWKNQSLMSALNGLRELKDPRGYDLAYHALEDLSLHRWRLPTPPVWDLRVFAVETIVALNKSSDAYGLLQRHFEQSLQEDDLEGIFNNAWLLVKLGDRRATTQLDLLADKYKGHPDYLSAVDQLRSQLKD